MPKKKPPRKIFKPEFPDVLFVSKNWDVIDTELDSLRFDDETRVARYLLETTGTVKHKTEFVEDH